jgi:hypothetical protein
MPDGVLNLYALRSGPALLLRGLPHGSPAAATPCRQPPAPVESGRPVDHRDRQRAYRQRHCRPRVTDQSALSVIPPAPFGCGETITSPVAVALRVAPPSRPEERADPIASYSPHSAMGTNDRVLPELLNGSVDLLILKSLAGGKRHGYAIARYIPASSGDVLELGESSLYTALQRLSSEWLGDRRVGRLRT